MEFTAEASNYAAWANERLESLSAQGADIGAWEELLTDLEQGTRDLAQELGAMSDSNPLAPEQSVELAERVSGLAGRLEGVQLDDLATSLSYAADELRTKQAGPEDLGRLSDVLETTGDALHALREQSRSFDSSQPIPTGEASPVDTPSMGDYGGYGKSNIANIFNAIDDIRKEAGLPSLREQHPTLFMDLGKKFHNLAVSLLEKDDSQKALASLGSALDDMSKAKEGLDSAQESGDKKDISKATSDFNAAETKLANALDAVAKDLGTNSPPTFAQESGLSAAESTMSEFLAAGGEITSELKGEVASVDSLAGLTVKEIGSLESLDGDTARDVAGMLDNLANRVNDLGLTDMADGLKEASEAIAQDPTTVDLDAVKDFTQESAGTLSELKTATDAFSFGPGELSSTGPGFDATSTLEQSQEQASGPEASPEMAADMELSR